MIQQYRTKVKYIEAVQYKITNWSEIEEFIYPNSVYFYSSSADHFRVNLDNVGGVFVGENYWLIKDNRGLMIYSPEEFIKLFEPVPDNE